MADVLKVRRKMILVLLAVLIGASIAVGAGRISSTLGPDDRYVEGNVCSEASSGSGNEACYRYLPQLGVAEGARNFPTPGPQPYRDAPSKSPST